MLSTLCIEFENDGIKIVEGKIKGKTLLIMKCQSFNLPKKCLYEGKIVNMDVLASIIKLSLTEMSIKTKKVIFLVNTNLIISRKLELPYLKSKKDIKTMIYYKLRDMLSANLDDYIYIYKIANVYFSEGVRYGDYIVNAMPVEIYSQYAELSKMLNLTLYNLDSSLNALENITLNNLYINTKQLNIENTYAFIDIKKNSMCFSIISKGINVFNKIFYPNYIEYNLDRVAEETAIYGSNNEVADVISKYLKYYYAAYKNKNHQIDKVYIYGMGYYDELENGLSNNIDIDVEKIESISNIILENNIINFNINNFLNCVAAMLNSRKENFLTEKQKYSRFKFNIAVSLIIVTMLISLVAALNGVIYLYKQLSMKNEISTMSLFVGNKENIDMNNKIIEDKKKIDSLEKYLYGVQNEQEVISKDDMVNAKIIKEIINSLPADTKINSLSIEKYNILLLCKSETINSISLFLNNLRAKAFIKNAHVPEIDYNNGYVYEILCDIEHGGNNE